MKFSLGPFVSFALGGMVFLGYLTYRWPYLVDPREPLVITAVAYATFGAVAVGFAGSRLPLVLVGIWATTVLVLAVGLTGGPGNLAFSIPLGLIIGSKWFAGWAASGGVIWLGLRLVRGEGRKQRPS